MTGERIDIEVTDKVSPGPAKKLREIASEALKADTALDRLKASMAQLDGSSLTRLANASAKLTNAQAREVSATARLESARAKLVLANGRAAIEEQRLATETARTEAAQQRAATATAQAAGAAARAEAASLRLAAAKRREEAATTGATAATRLNTAAQQANAASHRLNNHQLQNLTYQLNDVGVSLASGQSPFMVMLQQGSQISTVFGPGTGVTGIMRGLGQAIFSIARTFAPALAAVGVFAAGFGILTNEINKTTDVSVTMGDTIKATMQLIGEAIYDWVQPAVNAILPWFQRAYDFVIDATKTVVNGIVGGMKLVPLGVRLAVSAIPDHFRAAFYKAKSYVLTVLHDMLWYVNDFVGKVAGAFNDVFGTELNTAPLADGITALSEASGVAFREGHAAAQRAAGAWAEFRAEADAIMNRDYAGEAFAAIRQRSIELAQERIANEEDEAAATGGAAASLSRKMEILQEINKPLTDYLTDQAALNELLREGAITAGQFNQALSELALVQSLQDVDASLIGTPFADQAALDEIREAEQERLNIVQFALEARIIAEEEAAARIVEIQRQAAADVREIEAARNSMILTNARDTFGSLAEAAKGFAGEQSGIYKALFVASKAFAIADSIIKIQQGMANALALPFPANLAAYATVAAQAASIVSSIQAVQFADGGKVSGPGGPRDDKILARLSDGEYVVNARATAKNLPLLEAINSNREPAVRAMPQYAEGGRVQASAYSAQAPRVGNTPQLTLNSNPNINIYTRDPDTRVEMTPSQVDAMAARRVNRGQRNL